MNSEQLREAMLAAQAAMDEARAVARARGATWEQGEAARAAGRAYEAARAAYIASFPAQPKARTEYSR
jgi:uncharacterized protein YhbP (UPF0306 family)